MAEKDRIYKCLNPVGMQLPVKTFPLAPRLDSLDGKEIILAGGPIDFAEKLNSLLDDPDKREKIGKAGRRFVEEKHDWVNGAAHLEELYEQAVRQREPLKNRIVSVHPELVD